MKEAGIWALKIAATVVIGLFTAGVVVAVAARYNVPFLNPAGNGTEE